MERQHHTDCGFGKVQMTVLDPENIGCGRKVSIAELSRLQRCISELQPEKVLWGDAAIEEVTDNTRFVAHSIDRISRFSSDDKLFVRGAIHHACNDIVASAANPSLASISIAFTPEEIDTGRHLSVTSEISLTLSACGLKLGKLHSFVDYASSLTVSVSGNLRELGSFDFLKGSIYLSKSLGALKTIYLAGIGHTPGDIAGAQDAISKSSTWLLPVISDLNLRGSDVSGFGLIHAVDQLLLQHDLSGSIDMLDVPIVDPIVANVAVECLDRGAGYMPSALAVYNRAAWGELSELNGPLVLLVPATAESAFSKVAAGKRIGTWVRA